jgi:hypothetical protein
MSCKQLLDNYAQLADSSGISAEMQEEIDNLNRAVEEANQNLRIHRRLTKNLRLELKEARS